MFLDAANFEELAKLINELKPEVIINCIGLLNEQATINLFEAIQLNSLLPHFLAKQANLYGGKVVHISTDCVFSGCKGKYSESDVPDGTSMYARTKTLGELYDDPHLTLRTSIIGPEKKENGIGLFQWFMKQEGEIKGYKNVMWNGVTTLELAKVIEQCILHNVTGLYHLHAPVPISKHDLLQLIQQIYQKNDVKIIPDYDIFLDRTIMNTREKLRYEIPNYPAMISELYKWAKGDE